MRDFELLRMSISLFRVEYFRNSWHAGPLCVAVGDVRVVSDLRPGDRWSKVTDATGGYDIK